MIDKKLVFLGCYDSFMKMDYDFNDKNIVIQHVTGQLNEVLNLSQLTDPILIETKGSSLLPAVIATLLEFSNSPIKILDFGGGAGKQYVEIIKQLGETSLSKIYYHLVELPIFVKYAKPHLNNIFKKQIDKTFFIHESIPQEIKIDVVTCTSSMQYVEKWKELLNALFLMMPKLILIINVPINNKLTYCRFQNNLENVISQWVFGVNDLDNEFYLYKYKRIYTSIHEQNYPTEGTPIGTTTNFASLFYAKSNF